MNKTFAIVLLVLGFVVSGVAQTACDRYSPAGAGFSICIPAGWVLEDEKDSKFKSAVTPAGAALPANLLFIVDDSVQLKLKEYVDSTNDYTLKNSVALGFSSIKIDGRSDIVTDTKEQGIKTVLSEEMTGNKLLGVQYIFDIGTKKLLLTFTSVESGRAAYEKIFDAAIKTLRIEH